MPSSLRKAFVGCAAVIASAMGAGLFAGCAQEGKTPTCVDNVTAQGMQTVVLDENGDFVDPSRFCNPFGICIKGGNRRRAADCCVDADGTAFTGGKLAQCV